jgi:AcrR family transcriptional regulator
MRADAKRNRETLLAAAEQVYAERGVEAPLEDVARRAGVGIGTLYRHFPTRDALNEAVFRRQVEVLCDRVDELLATNPPDVALATWMRAFADHKDMAVALKSVLVPHEDLFTYSHRRIREAVGTLLAAGVDAGVLGRDVEVDDLLRAISGICLASGQPGSADRTERLIDLVVDGLRYRSRRTESGTGMPGRRSGAAAGVP